MLTIRNLQVTTIRGRVLIDGFSFTLNKGDRIALIGEEGNGKSTLLKIIAGIDVSSYVNFSGQIACDGKIGYLPQALSEEDLAKDVLSYISDDLDYSRLYALLNRIAVDDALLSARPLKSLSGGEKVRIALLKILYEDPDVLLLDEPSNDLDLKTVLWLEDFIRDCRIPLIFISHDEALLENCANGILHLEQLKRKSEARLNFERIGYREYSEKRLAYIKRNNMIAAKEKARFKEQLERWRQIYQKVEYRQNTISRGDPHGGQLLKKKMHSLKAQERDLEEKKANLREKYEPEEAIDVFFEKTFINPNKVILDLKLPELKNEGKLLSEDVELFVRGKDKICIVGDNGCGKSTLLRIIASELLKRDDLHAGYMPQNYREVMDYDLSPVEYLWDGNNTAERARVQSFLGALRFTATEMEERIGNISEGQKCKVLLLKLILEKKDVLLLDEPTRNLSPLSGPVIRKILDDFGGCIIAVSHDRRFIEEVTDSVYELSSRGLERIS